MNTHFRGIIFCLIWLFIYFQIIIVIWPFKDINFFQMCPCMLTVCRCGVLTSVRLEDFLKKGTVDRGNYVTMLNYKHVSSTKVSYESNAAIDKKVTSFHSSGGCFTNFFFLCFPIFLLSSFAWIWKLRFARLVLEHFKEVMSICIFPYGNVAAFISRF